MNGRPEYYFEDMVNCCAITIFQDGEVCIAAGRKVGWSKTLCGRQDGHLPAEQRSTSIAMLRRCIEVIKYHASKRVLWYEPTDDRRAEVYARAFARAGLTVRQDTCTVRIGGAR